MPRPSPEPWVAECRSAASRLATVPAFEAPMPPAPARSRAPVPDAPPRGLRRAARRVAVCALALLVGWLVFTESVLP